MTIKIFRVAEMIAAEKAADAAGVTYEQMMETAGKRVAEAIIACCPVKEKSVLVLVGPGNNGGDGLVAGRYLAEAGADVAFYLYKPRDAQDINFAKVQEMGLFTIDAGFDQRYRVLRTRLKITDIVIDALLGTGVTRPIGGELANLMKQVRAGVAERADFLAGGYQTGLTSIAHISDVSPAQTAPAVVAVDCPSGLNCDTGELDSLALPADLTVTFAGPKRGHFRFPGAGACGELVVADINISPALAAVQSVPVSLMTAVLARQLLPPRPRDGHKGTFGWALIAAGSANYWGAPLLAARGAYRVGAGLVGLAVPEKIRATVAGQMPEATYPPIPDQNRFGMQSARLLLKSADRYRALLIGPGMSEAAEFMEVLFKPNGELPKLPPLVIDADGLNMLAQMDAWHKRLPPRTILTPHPGEMARLMGDAPSTDISEPDRIELARAKAREWGHVVVLKGAYTVVAEPNGRCHVIPFANPILGVAGSGDVLAGVMAGLLAQGVGAYETAVLGAYLHGAAGQLASEEMGDAGLLAAELADYLPEVRRRLQ
ncbi:MAG: NAD(P)H-hydrate dehydratase [Ardenticatenaceae bacterium]|nr:NAD(P)H-hydrate dehydratase [Anaerolineales bacterium]MCB8920724.1 NAD(P)H-hydrate dehydratase [Ardenticatenaceae bacterium]MCB8989683.1 NAD(P)H-hydrate dehydratase [Ardenticatenaceae bacterium]MCB9002858.1 NAD(P)H-hydrate dehydratase [Ardenticatenaceae bacterium]